MALGNRRIIRQRTVAALTGLLPCLALALFAHFEGRLLHPVVIAMGSAAALFVHAAREPSRTGFWHHRRLRPLGVMGVLTAAAVFGLYLPRADLIPVAFAAAIVFRHQRQGTALVRQYMDDVDDLRGKILSLEAELRLSRLAAFEKADDRAPKAG